MPLSLTRSSANGPITKRQKVDDNDRESSRAVPESRIFAPFRTIGLVSSTEVPFTSIPLGKTTFQVTTSVGRCLQTYDLKRGLNLVFLTRPQTPEDVTAVLAWKDRIFASWCGKTGGSRPGIWVFKRGKKVDELVPPEGLNESINEIKIFGSWILGRCSTRIEVWKSDTYEHYTTIYTTAAVGGKNKLTRICTMPTFLNKIFAGREDGGIEIWNVSTGKLIYTILPPFPNCGAVTAMQPTPALSLMAVAYSEGQVVVHDVRTDETIITLHSHNLIASISFRTDGVGAGEDGRKAGVMATSGPESGDVTFWDLNDGGRVMGVLRGAHNPPSGTGALVGGGINRVEFLAGQPVIVTSGLDNSLKSWIFDETPYSPIPRILHSRNGHAAQVTLLQFLPSEADGAEGFGKWLLSAGKDRSLWGWSLRRDGQSTELSQGNIKKKARKLGLLTTNPLLNDLNTALDDLKAPEITCIASCLNRDGGMGAFAGTGPVWQKGNQQQKKPTDATQSGKTGWESVVTGHRGDKYARTWFWGRKKAGRWALETGDGGNVTSVSISPCGTFAVVGSQSGGIDKFNLQSGQHRQRFPSKLTPAQARKLRIQQLTEGEISLGEDRGKFQAGKGRHTKAVTGLVVDSLNKYVISCSLDGKIKFWDFMTGNLVDEIDWYPISVITDIKYHPASDLIALACNDMTLRIVDIETKKTIRELRGCQGGINDFCFSNDGRWIIASSSDCILRVWDLPTGHMIDAIRTARPCTAISFSSTGQYLATACEGEIGVNIWNNKTLFKHVPTRHISEDDIAELNGPTVSGEGGRGIIDGAFDEEDEPEDGVVPMQSLEQLSGEMMTLSLMPTARWQTLLYLDLIKQRNKPQEAPKVPEKAPFFLPSLENGKSLAVSAAGGAKDSKNETSRILTMDRLASEGDFTLILREGRESQNYDCFITHLKSLSPSAADLAIRSLNPISGTTNELVAFVYALTSRLAQKRDYELVQTWMSVFLRLHSDAIPHDEALVQALKEWRVEQQREARKLGELVGYCGGLIGFLRSPRT